MRKSFSDKLDNLDDPLSYMDNSVTPNVQIKYTDQFHNNDWTARKERNMLDWGIWNKNRRE